MTDIFQSGYPVTCKMEECPFPLITDIYVLALFEVFLVKEAKFDTFLFKMASNFFQNGWLPP